MPDTVYHSFSLCSDHGQWDLFIVPTTEEKTGPERLSILMMVNLLS